MKSTILAPVETTIDRVTPLYDYLLVRRLHDEEHTGLIVPSDMTLAKSGKWVKKGDHGPRRGEVVAAGRGDKVISLQHGTWPTGAWEDREPMDVKVGDIILYPRFEANHVQIGGEALTFVHEGDVMAVLDE